MRDPVSKLKLLQFAEELGKAARGTGCIYLTGGATAVLFGWRETTIDLNLKLDPEPPGVFEAMARLKDQLGVNVELAAPDDFVPALPGWKERSQWIDSYGGIDFYHYDFYGQVLSKVERDLDKDRTDVEWMLRAKLVEPARLLELFREVEPQLVRFPAINPVSLRERLERLVERGIP